MLRHTYFLTVLLYGTFFTGCKTDINNESLMVGVKIYNWDGDYERLFETWKANGINTVFASKELLSDGEFRTGLRQEGFTSFLIFPVFFDDKALEKDPGLYAIQSNGERAIDDWVHFACRTREDHREQKIQEARKYVELVKPDAISIDFIRYFVFWESVFPNHKIDSLPQTCFDQSCIRKF